MYACENCENAELSTEKVCCFFWYAKLEHKYFRTEFQLLSNLKLNTIKWPFIYQIICYTTLCLFQYTLQTSFSDFIQ